MVRRARLAQGTPREYRSASIRFTVCTIPSRHAARCEVSFRAVRASSPAPAELVSFPSRASTRSFPPLPFPPHRLRPHVQPRVRVREPHPEQHRDVRGEERGARLGRGRKRAPRAFYREHGRQPGDVAPRIPRRRPQEHGKGVEIPRVELLVQRPREDDAHEVALEERGGHLCRRERRDDRARGRRV